MSAFSCVCIRVGGQGVQTQQGEVRGDEYQEAERVPGGREGTTRAHWQVRGGRQVGWEAARGMFGGRCQVTIYVSEGKRQNMVSPWPQKRKQEASSKEIWSRRNGQGKCLLTFFWNARSGLVQRTDGLSLAKDPWSAWTRKRAKS